ncbi:hypothetical protein DFQ26_009089 [Actinomortierella ambigua]|nr:hypothetical protein DFQ26_009089 [Actinomortierella ambigua]
MQYACRLGYISRVHRRLSDIERQSVRSGSVYCFDEREAGMRRWTDGKSWSPSRVTGSFLTYRELDDSISHHNGKNVYRPHGLLKQSFSITTSDNQKLHLISYYTNDDVSSGRLSLTPSKDPRFASVVVPKGIYPETASPSEQHATATATGQNSPSPPMPNRSRHRPHHRAFLNQEEKDKQQQQQQQQQQQSQQQQHQQQQQQQQQPPQLSLAVPSPHRRNDSTGSSSSTPMGHRRTASGSSISLKEHRFSPIQTADMTKSLSARSRSNSNNLGYPGAMRAPQQRFKSTSPSSASFPTPPSHYSPATSWVSDEEPALVADYATPDAMMNSYEQQQQQQQSQQQQQQQQQQQPLHPLHAHQRNGAAPPPPPGIMIPPLRDVSPPSFQMNSSLPYPGQKFYGRPAARPASPHEQDSLSVLANLATDTLLLPKLEPQEVSREKMRWVEDDRQLRALSSMLRL